MSNQSPVRADFKPSRTIKDLLLNPGTRQAMDRVVPSFASPERLVGVALQAINKTPKLAACNPMSLLGSLMAASSLGLEVNSALGHAYLIPFENKYKGTTNAELVLGYRGMLYLAYQSNVIIRANAVRAGDTFEHEDGLEVRLRHVQKSVDKPIISAWAVAERVLPNGTVIKYPMVIPAEKIWSIRDASQGYKFAVASARKYNKPVDNPWVTHEEEMAIKTVIRRLFKHSGIGAQSTEQYISRALEIEDGVESGRMDMSAFADGDANLLANPSLAIADAEDVDEDGVVQEKSASVPAEKPAAKRNTRKPVERVEPEPETESAEQEDVVDQADDGADQKSSGGMTYDDALEMLMSADVVVDLRSAHDAISQSTLSDEAKQQLGEIYDERKAYMLNRSANR